MKKVAITAALLAMALGMTACSSGSTQNETTQEATEAAVQETTQAQTEETEEEEEDYFYGFVTEVTDTEVTIQDDEGETAVFDYSEADFSDDFPLSVGDGVEITFLGTRSEDVTKAVFVDLITSAAEEAQEAEAANEDPVLTGTIEKVEGTVLSLKSDEDDNVYKFDTSIAQQVSLGGIQAGTEAEITY